MSRKHERKVVVVDVAAGVVRKVDAPGGLGRVAKQSRRLRRLGRWGFTAADVLDEGVLPDGRTWAVHQYVPGPSLADARAVGLSGEQAHALARLHDAMADAGVRVHDLNAGNLVWHGGRWTIIDCGAVSRRGLRPRNEGGPQCTRPLVGDDR